MFGFLKDKLKKITEVFTKATTEVKEAPPEEKQAVPAKKDSKRPLKKEKAKPAKKETKKPAQAPPKVKIQKPAPVDVIEELPEEETPELLEEESIDEETDELAEEEKEEQAEADELDEPLTEEEETPEEETTVVDEKDDEEQRLVEEKTPAQEKRSFLDRILGRKKKEEATPELPPEEAQLEEELEETIVEEEVERHPAKPKAVEREPESGGFFGKLKAAITTKKLSREEFENIFTELEIELLENNVALEVVDKIKDDLWQGISTERFSRFAPEKRVQAALAQSIDELFLEPFDILANAKKTPIYVICAIGINGSGKTTTLAKLAHYFKKNGLEPVLAAGDTFRAAAIQQLEEHANRIGVKIIKQQYGADAAAVAFDAIQYAKANGCRVVLIDTAGRLHSNTNLMEEMKKIVRVARPDVTIFIGEATTGNDCVEQAVQFSAAVQIDGIVLSKVDVDERGGAALSISHVTRKPILFFGTGQTYDDLEPFDKAKILKQLTEE